MKKGINVREKKLKMYELQYKHKETRKWVTVKYFRNLDTALKDLMSRRHDIEWRVIEKTVNAKFYSRQKMEGGDKHETINRNERNARSST